LLIAQLQLSGIPFMGAQLAAGTLTTQKLMLLFFPVVEELLFHTFMV
jgi:hypothetical protein